MTTNLDRTSAQILQFPARGRFAATSLNQETPAMSAAATRVAKVAMDGAWYHEEAVEEAARDRKN